MPISYLRYHQGAPQCLLNREDILPDTRLLIFDPVLEENSSVILGDRFRSVDLAYQDCDVVIFRGSSVLPASEHRTLHQEVVNDPILGHLLRSTSIGLLSVESTERLAVPRLALRHLSGTHVWWKGPDASLSFVRELELEAFTFHSNAIVETTRHHFELPSGIHTRRFISIARLLSEPSTVSRISDWLLEDLVDVGSILIDQRAMLPLAFSLQALESHYFRRFPTIGMLREYPADRKTVTDSLAGLNIDPDDSRCLILLSVRSTGRVAQYFRAAHPESTTLRTLISTSNHFQDDREQGAAFLRISIEEFPRDKNGACRLCREKVPVMQVHRGTFELAETDNFPKQKILRKHIVPKARFWGIVDEMDAVNLHFDDDLGRHHPIFIDTIRLLGHKTVRQKCLRALARIRPPDLVLIPYHGSSGALAELIKACFPEAEVRILSADRCKIPSGLNPAIAAADRVLIADDALISGRTVRDLKAQIYRIAREFGSNLLLDVFVVLARPPSRKQLRDLKNLLSDDEGARLFSAYELLFPQPTRQACPFCDEQQFLEASIGKLSPTTRPVAEMRLRNLRGPMQNPLEWGNKTRHVVGSFFVQDARQKSRPARARSVFAAAQCVAISIRDAIYEAQEKGKSLRIDDHDILTKYFDAEILGALLRTFPRGHYHWIVNDHELVETLEGISDEETRHPSITEIGWTAVLGRYPAPPVLELLARAPDSPANMLMRELIHQSLGSEARVIVAADSKPILTP